MKDSIYSNAEDTPEAIQILMEIAQIYAQEATMAIPSRFADAIEKAAPALKKIGYIAMTRKEYWGG